METASRVVSSLTRITLAAALTFALSAGVFSPAARVRAETKSGHEFIYYNNAAHQTVVGVYVYCSSGQFIHWGVITPYDVIETSSC